MENITITNALLLAWAVIATVNALDARRLARVTLAMMYELLDDERLRTKVIGDFKQWKAGVK